MRVVLLDDSIPFDPFTPTVQPLGGAEKAFAGLASALGARGHEVRVFNRCKYRLNSDGAAWETWERPRPASVDLAIAFRKPSLLEQVPGAARKVLWLAAPAAYLDTPLNRELLDIHQPILVFWGPSHLATWKGTADLPAVMIPPGLRETFTRDEPALPDDPPRAIVTSHPLHGLDWLIDLWVAKIHPRKVSARLVVVSMALDRARGGGPLDEKLVSVFKKVLAAAGSGVVIERPQPDTSMADLYRRARVHLYPGREADILCTTLAESQACGLPAVARPLGATMERIRNGQTGYLVPDDDAFANVALQILGEEQVYLSMSREARDTQRARTWDQAAAAFEALGTVP